MLKYVKYVNVPTLNPVLNQNSLASYHSIAKP